MYWCYNEWSRKELLKFVCDKTWDDWVKNGWMVNEREFNTKMNDKYERSMLRWFDHIQWRNKEQSRQQTYEEKVIKLRKKKIKKVVIGWNS